MPGLGREKFTVENGIERRGSGPWELWIKDRIETQHNWQPPYSRDRRIRSQSRPTLAQVARARAMPWVSVVQVMEYPPGGSVRVYEHWEKFNGTWQRMRTMGGWGNEELPAGKSTIVKTKRRAARKAPRRSR